MDFFDSLKKVVSFFYDSGKQKFFAVFLVSVISMLIEITGLLCLFLVINSLLQSKDFISIPLFNYELLMQNAILILTFFYLFKFVFSVFNSRFQINYCFEINRKITSNLIKFYYSQSLQVFKSGKISDAMNKIFTIGGFFSDLILQAVIVFFTEIIMATLILISLLIFNYKLLLLLMIILLPVSIFLVFKSRRKIYSLGDSLMQNNVDYHQSVNVIINGIFDIKLSGRFEYFFKDFKDKITKLHSSKKIILLEHAFPSKVFEFVIILGIAVLFFISKYIGTYQYISGFVAAFATASFRFVPSVNRIISSIHNLKLYKNYIDFIDETLKKEYKIEPEIDLNSEKIETIELKNISFSFSGYKVFENFSIKLNNAEITGITGTSGSGKTTLINIISGLLQPDSGEIYINNKLVSGKNRDYLFHNSAYVMQEPFFFNGTISQNIAFGLEPTDNEKLKWCINAVKMGDWVNKQVNGTETIVGDMGTKLSGGQKQRLAIARAFYRKANLLILDEPSNSLDFENKTEIISLIYELTKQEKLITILVSHDEDIIKMCDKTVNISLP